MSKKTGFTLIELLVVIAIIGILSGIVLVVVNSSREKGKQAAIKQELNHLRTQAALYNAIWNGYTKIASYIEVNCNNVINDDIFNSPDIKPLIAKLGSLSGNKCVISAYQDRYAVMVKLPGTNNWWCVDSLDHSKMVPQNAISGSDMNCD